jgi:regulator of extracellular matrix RemA (YlzA/DUF370 family)
MIALACLGFGFIVVLAIVVGIAEHRQAPHHRLVAAERRRRWESRRQDYDRW